MGEETAFTVLIVSQVSQRAPFTKRAEEFCATGCSSGNEGVAISTKERGIGLPNAKEVRKRQMFGTIFVILTVIFLIGGQI